MSHVCVCVCGHACVCGACMCVVCDVYSVCLHLQCAMVCVMFCKKCDVRASTLCVSPVRLTACFNVCL